MKTALELATELLDHICPGYSQGDLIYLKKKITYDRKKQDKITRQACAEACDTIQVFAHQSFRAKCHNACMNVKAV